MEWNPIRADLVSTLVGFHSIFECCDFPIFKEVLRHKKENNEEKEKKKQKKTKNKTKNKKSNIGVKKMPRISTDVPGAAPFEDVRSQLRDKKQTPPKSKPNHSGKRRSDSKKDDRKGTVNNGGRHG